MYCFFSIRNDPIWLRYALRVQNENNNNNIHNNNNNRNYRDLCTTRTYVRRDGVLIRARVAADCAKNVAQIYIATITIIIIISLTRDVFVFATRKTRPADERVCIGPCAKPARATSSRNRPGPDSTAQNVIFFCLRTGCSKPNGRHPPTHTHRPPAEIRFGPEPLRPQ